MKIMVCCSYYHRIEPECDAGLELLRKSTKHKYGIRKGKGVELTQVRNRLLWDVEKYDKILTVDSDIGFTEADIDHLIALKSEFCALPYIIKNFPNMYEAGILDEGRIVERYSIERKEPCHVGYVGAGFSLFDSVILKKMEYPYYRQEIIPTEEGHLFDKETSGEDVGFCMNAARHGIKILVDFSRPVRHLARSDERQGGEKALSLTPFEVGCVMKGLDELPRKLSNPIYDKIANQVGYRE